MSCVIKWFYPIGIVILTTGSVLLIGNIANIDTLKVAARKLSDIARVKFLIRRWSIVSRGEIVAKQKRYDPFGFLKMGPRRLNTIAYVVCLIMGIGLVAWPIFLFSNFHNPFLLLVSAPLWWQRCLFLFLFCFAVVVVGNFIYMMTAVMAVRNLLASRKITVIIPIPLTPFGYKIPPYPKWCKTFSERLAYFFGYFIFMVRFSLLWGFASTVGIAWGLPTWCLFMVSIVFPLRGWKKGLNYLENKLRFKNPVQTLGLVLVLSGAGLEVVVGVFWALGYL